MVVKVLALAGVLLLIGGMLLAAPASSCAVPCEHGQHVGNPHCEEGPSLGLPAGLAATPELDSSMLFGVGLVGLAGFRWYQRRKQPAA
jgi:hypothetical protein